MKWAIASKADKITIVAWAFGWTQQDHERSRLFFVRPEQIPILQVSVGVGGRAGDQGSHEQPPLDDAALKLRSHWSTGAASAWGTWRGFFSLLSPFSCFIACFSAGRSASMHSATAFGLPGMLMIWKERDPEWVLQKWRVWNQEAFFGFRSVQVSILLSHTRLGIASQMVSPVPNRTMQAPVSTEQKHLNPAKFKTLNAIEESAFCVSCTVGYDL